MESIKRRVTPTCWVGSVPLGSCHPVVVQSMTNTATEDLQATADQVEQLAAAGSELVRITVNTPEAARAVGQIHELLQQRGIEVPLVGDFHYNGHRLLRENPDCARALAKYRINPGNVGGTRTHDDNFQAMIEVALEHDKAVRIGVNWGSLDQKLLTRLMDENASSPQPRSAREVYLEAMVQSALSSAAAAETLGLGRERIVLSVKMSAVPDMVEVYRRLAERSDHVLHLGLTEAGMGLKGTVASSAALAILLQEGIGDTIRVSLTPKPGGERAEEVRICQQLLQSLGLRSFAPQVTACPGCGRTTSTLFQELAASIDQRMQARMREWREIYPGVESLQVAVMGCVVNGPGESKHADIGISLPGTGESPRAPVYIDGELHSTLEGEDLASEFTALVEEYVSRRYGRSS